MGDLKIGWNDVLSRLSPDSLAGAFIYLLLFVLAALVLSRALRIGVHGAMTRAGHLDRTTISFLQQIGTASIWVVMLILYAHLIPALRAMGTALLAGASVASVVIGLAAQSTLGNLVAGVSITIYRPFRLGDTLQVTAPTGTEIGTVELISLGYTTLRTFDGRLVVLPNSIAAAQVTINLGENHVPAALAITIRVPRGGDTDAMCTRATEVAKKVAGAGAVIGCYLTQIDGDRAVLELRIRSPSLAERDVLRSRVVTALAQHFAAQDAGTSAEQQPSFL
jgi:small conductance mechanosensitive channel